MLTWPDLNLPPINLWSLSNYKSTEKTMNVRKFKAYWNSIGRPEIEFKITSNTKWAISFTECSFIASFDYRIKDDPHWELRAKWIDSDFTLPIEYYDTGTKVWYRDMDPVWTASALYREATQKEAESKSDSYNKGYTNGWNDALENLKTKCEDMHSKRSKNG